MTDKKVELIRENEELRVRLEAAEEALGAIRRGEVDALVVYGEEGDRVYTLEGADYTYRVMVENISEGVATLQCDGMILYGNQRMAQMLGVPLETVLGSELARFISPIDRPAYQALLRKGAAGFSKGEISLQNDQGAVLPVLLSLSSVESHGERLICLVATDLTEQKRGEEILAAEKMARSILDQASEAIVVCDTDGVIIRASQSTVAICGEDPLFLPFDKVFSLRLLENGNSEEEFSIGEVLKGKYYRGIEARLEWQNPAPRNHPLERSDGIDLLLSAAPLHGERDEILGCILSITDITGRKEAERRISAEREWFKTTLASIGDAVITTDPQGAVTFLNPVAELITSWTNAEAAGQPMEQIFPLIHEFTHQPVELPVAKVVHSGQVIDLAKNTALISRSGQIIPIEDSAAPIQDMDGQILGVVMVFHDVTPRRVAERILRESQQRLFMTTEATEIGMWDWDLVTNTLTWDERCKALFNLPPETPLNHQTFLQAVHPADRQKVDNAAQTAIAEHTLFEVEYRTIWPNGSVHWIYSKGNSVYNQADDPLQMFGVAMDITRRKAIEEEIRSSLSHIEVQHRLIGQREQERQQIARDLHDGPVQALIGAIYTLRSLDLNDFTPEVAEQLESVQSNLQEQVSELRTYAGELRPPSLAKFGLVKAIQSHIDTFQRKHPELTLTFEKDWSGPLLAEDIRLALFRIYQECLTNIARHAEATQLDIRIKKSQRQITLEIEDNGTGFQVPDDWLEFARQGHLGLVGMRERTEAIGGTAEITSQPDKGTRIRVVVPLQEQKSSSTNPERE